MWLVAPVSGGTSEDSSLRQHGAGLRFSANRGRRSLPGRCRWAKRRVVVSLTHTPEFAAAQGGWCLGSPNILESFRQARSAERKEIKKEDIRNTDDRASPINVYGGRWLLCEPLPLTYAPPPLEADSVT